MKTAIIIPSIREECINKFLKEWDFRNGNSVFVIEDNPKKTFKLDSSVYHYAWEDIDKELGKDSWIIPRRTDCIRSFGFYKAFKSKEDFDVFITLDDDCYPQPDKYELGFIEDHWAELEIEFPRWVWTTKKHPSRGVPYNDIGAVPNMINMGFWNGVADLSAISQLLLGPISLEPRKMHPVPSGAFFSMCGMNLSFRREVLPLMYFLLMGKDWPYDRLGDIWSGIIAKKICDYFNYAVTSGHPPVLHTKASDVWANLRKEYPGMEVNESFWRIIDNIKLEGESITDCYLQIAEGLPKKDKYFKKLSEAMKIWIKLLST